MAQDGVMHQKTKKVSGGKVGSMNGSLSANGSQEDSVKVQRE